MLSPNVVIPFDDTNANIPNGFDRETTLDEKFVKGWGAEAVGTDGGSDTHTHPSVSHEHQPSSHNHTFISQERTANPDGARSGNNNSGNRHYHDGSSNSTTLSSTTNQTPTWLDYSSLPPYYEVIFIKANSYQLVPQNGIVYRQTTTRSNMISHSASADRFLRGAQAGGDAGTTGGQYEHTHNISHTHVTGHTHGGTSSQSIGDQIGTDGDQSAANRTHTHIVVMYEKTRTLIASNPVTTTSGGTSGEDIEPEYTKLNPFVASSGNTVPVKGDICLWTDDPANIPLGWKLCDGTNGTVDMRDRFVKSPDTVPEIPSTGGSNTHAHPGVIHTHSTSTPQHNHTGNLQTSYDNKNAGVHNDGYRMYPVHGHDTLTSVSTKTMSHGSATTTAEDSDNQPAYRTVVYIEFEYSTVGGSFIYNLL